MHVEDDTALLGLRTAYLRAVREGASEFTADFRAGTFGRTPMGDIALAPLDAHEPPPIDVVLRCDDIAVLDGVALQVAARTVTVEGLAFTGALRSPLAITASAAIELHRVTVLGARVDERQRAVVDLTAAARDTRVLLRECTLAESDAPGGALLGLYSFGGAWFDSATLRACTLAGGTCDSVLMIEALRNLDAEDCHLSRARVLIRMAWPTERAELAACTLAGPVLEVINAAPVEVEPMRLTRGTRVSGPLAPDGPIADETVEMLDGLADEIAARVAEARERFTMGGPGLEPGTSCL